MNDVMCVTIDVCHLEKRWSSLKNDLNVFIVLSIALAISRNLSVDSSVGLAGDVVARLSLFVLSRSIW